MRIGFHFASGDLFLARALKAQLAHADGFGSAHNRRTEGTAGHRTSRIQVAAASFRIERGTRLLIRKVRKALFGGLAFVQYARGEVAGKRGPDPCDGLASPLPNPQRTLRLIRIQLRKPALKPH